MILDKKACSCYSVKYVDFSKNLLSINLRDKNVLADLICILQVNTQDERKSKYKQAAPAAP
jgi:hypothetical protein